jgi:transposase-like protein
MGQNSKFSKEDKIKVCKAYKAGKENYMSLAKNIGASPITIRKWYLSYSYHGESAFDSFDRNASYTKEFKQEIVEAYISGKYSLVELCGKYNISVSMTYRWANLYNSGVEMKDYDPKGAV